ncbi:unnamed protein product [Vitrella brassicaformis CCMP3155]|uniref:Uncharacterized protein n=1 Tax=Vitrella brassicaformis (strain CCMP3155) TaxID=1169540 RepID=A0A0G4F1G7_VITBC|nr:unnamed protein product [Vitrella brassicaformis CCMP3155]|eukprot:CEM05235.1 unnamed protein product [Vitrella brassicaformis CCMP3155]
MHSYLDLLAAHGADLIAKDAKGCTPFDYAVVQGGGDVVEWLLEQLGTSEIDKSHPLGGTTPLTAADSHLSDQLRARAPLQQIDRAKQVIRALLSNGADIQLMRRSGRKEDIPHRLVQDIQNEMHSQLSAPVEPPPAPGSSVRTGAVKSDTAEQPPASSSAVDPPRIRSAPGAFPTTQDTPEPVYERTLRELLQPQGYGLRTTWR